MKFQWYPWLSRKLAPVFNLVGVRRRRLHSVEFQYGQLEPLQLLAGDFYNAIDTGLQGHYDEFLTGAGSVLGTHFTNEFEAALDQAVITLNQDGPHDDQTGLGEAFAGYFGDLQAGVKIGIDSAADFAVETYDSYIEPALEVAGEGLYNTFQNSTFTDVATYTLPVACWTSVLFAAPTGVGAVVLGSMCTKLTADAYSNFATDFVSETTDVVINNSDFSQPTKDFWIDVKNTAVTAKDLWSFTSLSSIRNGFQAIKNIPAIKNSLFAAGGDLLDDIGDEIATKVNPILTDLLKSGDPVSQSALQALGIEQQSKILIQRTGQGALLAIDQGQLTVDDRDNLSFFFNDLVYVRDYLGFSHSDAVKLIQATTNVSNLVKAEEGVVTIRGTNHDDTVDLGINPNNSLEVIVTINDQAAATFAVHEVKEFRVSLLAGNDNFSNRTAIPSFVNGGLGDDDLIGGFGPDILSGNSGNDILVGRQGDDLLYGGNGNDELWGGSGTNVIYGGPGSDQEFNDRTLINLSQVVDATEFHRAPNGSAASLTGVEVSGQIFAQNEKILIRPTQFNLNGGELETFEARRFGTDELMGFSTSRADGYTIEIDAQDLAPGDYHLITHFVGQNGFVSNWYSVYFRITSDSVPPEISGLNVSPEFVSQPDRFDVSIAEVQGAEVVLIHGDLNDDGIFSSNELLGQLTGSSNWSASFDSVYLPPGEVSIQATGVFDGNSSAPLTSDVFVFAASSNPDEDKYTGSDSNDRFDIEYNTLQRNGGPKTTLSNNRSLYLDLVTNGQDEIYIDQDQTVYNPGIRAEGGGSGFDDLLIDGAESTYQVGAFEDGYVTLIEQTDSPIIPVQAFHEAQDVPGGRIQGLDGAWSVAITQSGEHLYAIGNDTNRLLIMHRDPISSRMRLHSTFQHNALRGARSLVISHDAQNIYIATEDDRDVSGNDSSLVVLDRNADGSVFLRQEIKQGVGIDGLDELKFVAISPDDQHVYAVGNGQDVLSVFDRNGAGSLNLLQQFQDLGSPSPVAGATLIDYMRGAGSVVVSPDGANVYITAEFDNSLLTFARNQSSGELTHLTTLSDNAMLDGAVSVAISQDGKMLVTANYDDDSIAVFHRLADGSVTFNARYIDLADLDGAQSVAVSPDGTWVVAVSHKAEKLVLFERNPLTENLTKVATYDKNDAGFQYLNGPSQVNFSPDGRTIVVVSRDDNNLSVPDNGLMAFRLPEKIKVAYEDFDKAVFQTSAANATRTHESGNERVLISGNTSNQQFTVSDQSTTVLDTPVGPLVFQHSFRDSEPGLASLDEIQDLDITPDGKYLVGSNQDRNFASIMLFKRDHATGKIQLLHEFSDTSSTKLLEINDITIGASGESLYVTSQEERALTVLRINRDLEQIEFVQTVDFPTMTTPEEVIESPNGANVYVAHFGRDEVLMYARNLTTGTLTGMGSFPSADLNGVSDLVMDPLGEQLFAVSRHADSLLTFDVASNGTLSLRSTFKNNVGGVTGLDSPTDVAISPDGKTILVTSSFSKSLTVFERNNGNLSFQHDYRNGSSVGGQQLTHLDFPEYVEFSPDGKRVYVSSGGSNDAILSFDADSNNQLTFLGAVANGQNEHTDLNSPNGIAISPIGNQVFVAGDDALVVLTEPSKLEVGYHSLNSIHLAGEGGADHFSVTPSVSTTYTVDGGTNQGGADTLVVDALGRSYYDDGSTIFVVGHQPIHHTGIENVVINNGNHRPVLDSVIDHAFEDIQQDTLDPLGNAISELITEHSISDPDQSPAAESVVVTGADSSNGVWQYSLSNGVTWNDLPAVSFSSALMLTGFSRLRFIPDAGYSGQSHVTIHATDQTDGSTPGDLIDLNSYSNYGESSPISTASDQVILDVVKSPTVLGVQIADGNMQRSTIENLVVTFDGQVELAAGAFSVIQRSDAKGATGTQVSTSWTTSTVNGNTVATITFDSLTRNTLGALVDGNYQLTIDHTKVTAPGTEFSMAEDFVFGDKASDRFFSLFGDIDGNRVINAFDIGRFKAALQGAFDPAFDYDGNGVLNALDIGRLKNNLNKSMPFV